MAEPTVSSFPPQSKLPDKHKQALERLIRVAQSDTGQSRRIANFLLVWWNATDNGGFDLTDLWNVDASLAYDMVLIFQLVSVCRYYPDHFGYKKEIEAIWERWRKQP